MQTKQIFLRGGRVVCPLSNVDAIADVQIADGRVVAVGENLSGEGQEVDCTGLVVAPGFVDLGAELCDPGFVWREDLRSGSEAGAAVSCSPFPSRAQPSAIARCVFHWFPSLRLPACNRVLPLCAAPSAAPKCGASGLALGSVRPALWYRRTALRALRTWAPRQ